MPPVKDPIFVAHPDDPSTVIVKSRLQLPALARGGWVEVDPPAPKPAKRKRAPKSPKADAVVEPTSTPDAIPSQEKSA